MTTPLTVTVIVPVHNVAAHVAACIDSLRAQTFPDFEVLVIDDGSTDGSGDAARVAIGDDPRFRVIRQDNRGLSGARNTGLEHARGEFVAFLDSDDQFAPTFLERMLQALRTDGGDWVACAIALCFPDDTVFEHSAVHGAPVHQPGPARRIAMDDCTEIARHFPSAWNKLYRRSLIGSQRFTERTWFEDHEFFWSLAGRTGHMLYLPDPLYRHTRDRPGQITGADDERVFEQFDVLERLARLVHATGAARPDEGFARLATRLVHERAGALRTPERRQRFLRQAGAFFERHQIAYSPFWDADICASVGLAMRGELPLSVVLRTQGTRPEALEPTLRALGYQVMRDFEVLTDDPDALGRGHLPNGATVRALDGAPGDVARGKYLIALTPGDQLAPPAFKIWLNGMERLDVSLGLTAFMPGDWNAPKHQVPFLVPAEFQPEIDATGPLGELLPLSVMRALQLKPEPSARILRRDLFAGAQACEPSVAPAVETMALAVAAGQAAYFPDPVIAIVPRPAPPLPDPFSLARSVRAVAYMPEMSGQPRGWQAAIYARAMEPRLATLSRRWQRWWLLGRVLMAARLYGLRSSPEFPPDHRTAPGLIKALRLPPPRP
ncbi:MAG: succinoglycan biosynthesis protein ExoO [Rhodobacteraceae bacterium HLUCCA12]|nr:MAG: succinoglycan biosynthesis protein ExoO [Rhodobacteraceae bacterium HLUCCA12]